MMYDKIIPAKGDPFQNLAAFFHQDFDLLFSDFDAGMNAYIFGLRVEERKALRDALQLVLGGTQAESDVRKAWVHAGAQWMSKEVNLREKLLGVIERL